MRTKIIIKSDPPNSLTPRRMHYIYSAGPDMSFDFDLLCMVGKPWIPLFKAELERRGIQTELVDDDTGYYERRKL